MKRGKNKEFIIAGVLMILKRNYNIKLKDYQEIDCKLGIGENISILRDRYQMKNIDLNEVDYL